MKTKLLTWILVFCLVILFSTVILQRFSSKEGSLTQQPTYAVSESELWKLIQNYKMNTSGYEYETLPSLCEFADIRLKEIQVDTFHKDVGRIYSTNNNIAEVSENLGSWGGESKNYLNGWLSSPPHKAALDRDYKYSCLRCSSHHCVHLFANLKE